MNIYMLILFASKGQMDATRTPEEAQRSRAAWQTWHEELEASDRLAGGLQVQDEGHRVSSTGVDDLASTPGDALLVGGYFLIKAETLQEATDIAQGCPLVAAGGLVEVRPAMP